MSHEHFRSCIDACNACAEACGDCAKSCLFEPNRHELTRCIQLDLDCAEICQLAATYMARDSELAGEICALCARVCEWCAEECERHDMDHCRRCAESCRQCARECAALPGRVKTRSLARGAKPTAH
jgi:hypothetical protein